MEVSPTLRWFGIDVSKATFEAALPARGPRKAPHGTFSRSPEGCQACLGWMETHLGSGDSPCLVMEATGGYSRELADWFRALREGLRISIAPPFRVHHFAKGLGLSNKTDAQDAAMLARFGEVHSPTAYHPLSPAYEQLRALTRERSALVKAAQALRNRNERPSDARVAQRVRERLIAEYQKAVTELDQAIATVIAEDPDLAPDALRLQSIPGVGPIVAATLMGELGDLRAFRHPKALAAFTGIAPAWKESGSSVHARAHMTKHGNGRVRQVLYLAAMAATRGDTPLARSYRHLIEAGKPPRVALVATMRKMLVLCRVLLIEGCDYDPAFPTRPIRSAPGPWHPSLSLQGEPQPRRPSGARISARKATSNPPNLDGQPTLPVQRIPPRRGAASERDNQAAEPVIRIFKGALRWPVPFAPASGSATGAARRPPSSTAH